MSYGGIITSLKVPDRAGKLADVVLGFDTPQGYLAEPTAAVLRRASSAATATGSRRASSRSTAQTYTLATNNGPNHLHGGNKGFDKVSGTRDRARRDGASAMLHAHQPGRRGRLSRATSQVRVTYTLPRRTS